MKLPIFMRPLYRIGERNTKSFFFLFSKLRYGSFEFNPENFANIWQIKWNWIGSKKFETVRIYFLVNFRLWLSSKKFCYHDNGTDVTTSPLYAVCVENLSKIGHFRVPKTLTFKMRLGAQPFLWKWVLFAWEWIMISVSKAEQLPSFWNRGPRELGNGLLN